MYVSSFTSLWGNCSNVFIRTSQEVFGGVEPGENCIGIFVVVGLAFFNSTNILCNAGSSAVGFMFPWM